MSDPEAAAAAVSSSTSSAESSTSLPPAESRARSAPTAGHVPYSVKKRQEDKHRKKDSKSYENVSKVLANMEDPLGKVACLEGHYKDLYDDMRNLSHANVQLTKQSAAYQKERDHHQAELAKSVVARSRVEEICRMLQRQNKEVKDESMARIKEEEERRKQISQQFTERLGDINTMMEENKEKSDKLREENLKMTAKLAELYSQFQRREEDITRMSHQLELERQFSQATLAKMELEIAAEKELHIKEQEVMRSNLEKSEANCSILVETVKGLQDHIDVYKNQYEDFESTMSKSTKVFDKFKEEIANMTRQVTLLEKEAQSWKNKFQNSMKALVEMSEVKKNQDLYVQSVDKKNDQLNKLCRQLQVDRSHYLKLLKSHGIEPSPSTGKIPEDDPKVSKKEKELQLLKDNLQAVQSELSRITVEETEKIQVYKTEETSQVVEDADEGAKCLDMMPKVKGKKILGRGSAEPLADTEKKLTDEVDIQDKEHES